MDESRGADLRDGIGVHDICVVHFHFKYMTLCVRALVRQALSERQCRHDKRMFAKNGKHHWYELRPEIVQCTHTQTHTLSSWRCHMPYAIRHACDIVHRCACDLRTQYHFHFEIAAKIWKCASLLRSNAIRVHVVQRKWCAATMHLARRSSKAALNVWSALLVALVHKMMVLRRYKCRTPSFRSGFVLASISSSDAFRTAILMSLVANGSFDLIYVS